jgi:hypothetical protein
MIPPLPVLTAGAFCVPHAGQFPWFVNGLVSRTPQNLSSYRPVPRPTRSPTARRRRILTETADDVVSAHTNQAQETAGTGWEEISPPYNGGGHMCLFPLPALPRPFVGLTRGRLGLAATTGDRAVG